ncbi:enoyl-CoA hydratase/isomerase family protein [Pseudonocardia humida]|uniref:Enoyl-CoA hydratase/isomerase family protein n=1 Tax=Pseudonocardia humida TaxID=2800819 RepID=A0ABT1A242_9PSEU|nr:enoyl-CoA hydratase/isomerase family protein [Pseudonocardia humida]MCO1657073.1 enoyl-CoA hydratase/isomerase family protein [Pseudonocardia humida]
MTAPSSASVSLDRDGAVAVLTISNPGVHNALTMTMAEQLGDACAEIERDDTVGGVVVRGADGTFCSGADTRAWAELYADPLADEAYRDTDAMYATFMRVGALPVPTVAAVRGVAVGAGLNLALATDLRIVARDARIKAGFLQAGIHPGGGFFTIAARVAGREAAAATGLFSRELSGVRAVEVGLAWEAVPDEQVEAVAIETVGTVAADPLLARRVVHSFRLETAASSMSWAAALEVERGVQIWTQARRLRKLTDERNGSQT